MSEYAKEAIALGIIVVFFLFCTGYGVKRFGAMEKRINGQAKGSLSARLFAIGYAVLIGMGGGGLYLCFCELLNLVGR